MCVCDMNISMYRISYFPYLLNNKYGNYFLNRFHFYLLCQRVCLNEKRNLGDPEIILSSPLISFI